MRTNELIGGVSPLKRKTSRKRAGTVASSKKGTHTKRQDRSGYSRSGKEGVNVAGFTPNTRVTSSMVESMPSPSQKGKSNKGDKTIIGTDAGGNPVYNYYGDVDNSKEINIEDSFNQNVNVDQENVAGSGTNKKKTKVYKTEDQVCHPDYLAKHGKGGPGSPECDAYKRYRKNNPKPKADNTKIKQKNKSNIKIIGHKDINIG